MVRPFAATVWREGKWYVPQCLEVDVAGQGETEEALANLKQALELHFEPPQATRPPGVRMIGRKLGLLGLPLLPLLVVGLAPGKDKDKDKTLNPGHAENAAVAISATAYTERSEIQQLIGSDIGPYYTVLQVTVTPKAAKYKVDPDDFLLRTDKDGERTHPLAPSQIGGKADLVLHEVRTPTVGVGNNGPVWGGVPGTGSQPMQLPGNGGSMGNGAGGSTVAATVNQDKDKDKGKHDPVLDVLKQKVLPDKETDGPLTGLLIFSLEKQKVKDLELVYTTPQGPLRLRFK